MPTYRLIAMATLSVALASAATAQQTAPMHVHDHMHMPAAADARQAVQFPPAMQASFLANMRDHMQTIDNIVQALAADDYAGASRAAAERLGLESASAAGCKPKASAASPASVAAITMKGATPSSTPAAPSMDEMMALHMPEPMRAMGLSMHTAASEFAAVAASADSARDRTAALKALSEVTKNCVACHSSYRLR
jgi:hypothetical protein